jgi:leucyl-tRNA synthetase
VLLPDVEAYQPSGTGESPLANIPEFVNTTCPQCGQPARRETDTMGGFACSSWYFLRFCDPHNDKEPFAPHIADELWEAYGFEGFTLQQPYPQYDESLARADEFEMVVQVNGKLRDRIVVPADISREAMEQLALQSPRVQAHLGGKPPRKIIVVPGKLVNIVV